MRELIGDLWAMHAAGAVIAITTGGAVSRKGRCAMPRGCAFEAARRFPALPEILGVLVQAQGNHVYDLGNRIVSFPVEATPWERPDPALIDQSCRELVALADAHGWKEVVVPRPGCGTGGLRWPDVRPILQRHFDERFAIISKEGEV